MDDATEEPEQEAYWVQEELDDQMLETLAAEDDEDAALVLQFEDAINETIQNDEGLCAFYSSYQDAQKRLAEKVRFRGFWSVRKGEKGKKGKAKGKGKGSLASRIANSYCRICMKKGHWKNECPSRAMQNSGSGPSSNQVPTTFTVVEEAPEVLINMAIAEEPRSMGNAQVPDLLSQLPDWVRQKARRSPCNLTFRFGNHQTLVSRHALILPLGSKSFRIAVVEGKTPFLISNAFLKGLKAVIDTDHETLYSRVLSRYLDLQKSSKNLFLMNINQLWEHEKPSEDVQGQCSRPELHSLVSEVKSMPTKQSVQPAEDQVKEVQKMTLAELETETIQFGKAKYGQTFPTAFKDGKWTDWFVTTYEHSSKIEHVKYVTYVTKRLDAEIEMDRQKGKKKSSAASKSAPAPKLESAWDAPEVDEGDSEFSEFIPILDSPQQVMIGEQLSIVQEENHNLRGRMTQIEMAIQELIQHVKAMKTEP
eukprot:s2174_g13.t1